MKLTLIPRPARQPGKFFLIFIVVGCIAMFFGSSCRSTDSRAAQIKLAPLAEMPGYVRRAPRDVQEAYRFAATNPALLRQVPCYCGCNAMGHQHNLACYVAEFEADGQVAKFDEHASYCQVCVDITHDAMRLQRSGRSLEDIRHYIDTTYSKYGPPTVAESEAEN